MSRCFLKVINIKKLVVPGFCIIFSLCLVVFSDTAMESALKGLNLWFNIVFPALFPFFVASELLNSTGFIKSMGILLEPIMRPLFKLPGYASFAFLMGIASGYPVGAKITTDMRKNNLLTSEEANRLLAFSNNSGPLFIIGAVANGMFKMPEIGVLLLACHIAACITVGVILALKGPQKRMSPGRSTYKHLISRFKHEFIKYQSRPSFCFATIFGNAVKNSVATIFVIGGFIIIFSVIINLLLKTGIIEICSSLLAGMAKPFNVKKDIINSILSGFFEITTGANMAALAQQSPISHRLAAVSLIIGWAGLSVHLQVFSIISNTDIKIKNYLLGKLLQGIFAAVYTYLGFMSFERFLLKPAGAFARSFETRDYTWHTALLFSACHLFIILGLFTVMYIINVLLNRRKYPH